MVNVSRLHRPPFARASGSATQPPDTSGSLCNADLGTLRQSLTDYLDKELAHTVIETGTAAPTAAFQRVDRRAALHAQEVGNPAVTGADALVALFPETRSPAARLLAEQGVSRWRVDKAIAKASAKDKG